MGLITDQNGKADIHQFFEYLWNADKRFAIAFWYGWAIQDGKLLGL